MPSFTVKAVGGAAAAYMVAQQVQCPPLVIPLITSAALQVAATVGSAGASFAGAIIGANVGTKMKTRRNMLTGRQEFVAPEGVPQFEFDRCATDMSAESVTVTVTGPVSNNGVQVDGLPATCMNLAGVIDGDAVGGPVPIPCGSACILYDNLSADDYNNMAGTFEGLKNA